jgi:hypothetical protein
VDNRFSTFSYAAAHSAPSFAQNLAAAASYLIGCLGYIAVPLIASYWLLRPSVPALRDVARPADMHRRLVLFIQLTLIVLPVPFALAMGLRIVPLWTMPAWTLLPVVLLASPLIAVGREAVRRIVAVTALFTLAMLAVAPAVALAIHLTNRRARLNTPRCSPRRSSSNGAPAVPLRFRWSPATRCWRPTPRSICAPPRDPSPPLMSRR